MTLYNCKPDATSYRVTKFTPDLEVESSYLTSTDSCECPAGHRHTCRHRQMLPLFEAKGATRGQWFLDFDRRVWIRTVGEEDFEAQAAYQESTVPAPEPAFTQQEAMVAMETATGNLPAHAFSMLDLAKPVGDPRPTIPTYTLAPKPFLRRI